jgi:MYXO-CTERM domain-containing protein
VRLTHAEEFVRRAMRIVVRAMLPAALAVAAASQGARAQTLVVDSASGPITARELEAFKAFMQTRTPPANTWGKPGEHNALADGPAGRDLEAMGLMFEATGDVAILNRMVFFADAFVAMRNDLPGGEHRVMWTGNVDKLWPPEAPTGAAQPGQVTYAGGENSDTIAHIEYAALAILKTRALWSTTVPEGDPHAFGRTYLDRAKTYAARCAEANDEYAAKYFVQPGTNLIRNPPNWPKGFHTMEAINIQMMVDGGFQRDAEIHELLGGDPARVARYDAIVKASVRECLNGVKSGAYVVAGHTVYKWNYYPSRSGGAESVGHAAYDVLGIWRAYHRPLYGITRAEVTPIADTVSFVISLGNGNFASVVDGTGTPQNYMHPEWHLAGEWNDTALALMGNAAIASKRYVSSPLVTAAILATKSRLASPPTGGPDAGVAPTVDAGPSPDAGGALRPDSAPGAPDAAAPARPDAAVVDIDGPEAPPSMPPTPTPRSIRGSGCACSLTDAGGSGTSTLTLLMLSLLELRRRRRLAAARARR